MSNSWLNRFLGRNAQTPRACAKERLLGVVIEDRSAIPSSVLELVRKEIVEVVKKYLIIDDQAVDVKLEKDEDGTYALVSHVVSRGVRKNEGIPAA